MKSREDLRLEGYFAYFNAIDKCPYGGMSNYQQWWWEGYEDAQWEVCFESTDFH